MAKIQTPKEIYARPKYKA